MLTVVFGCIHVLLSVFFGVFGMSLMPEELQAKNSRDSLFLLSPLLGSGVWIGLTVFAGIFLPYRAEILVAEVFLAAVWVVWKRKRLFLPEDVRKGWVVALFIVFAAFLSRLAAPFEINGGLYFSEAVYDHVKSAIVDSIASHGLFPLNPWLAEAGNPLPLVYYFGWHAWTAQLSILTGCSGYFAECVMIGLTALQVLLGIAGAGGIIGAVRRHRELFLLVLLLFSGNFWRDSIIRHMPAFCWDVFGPYEFPGFWRFSDNFLWAPQHVISGGLVLLILILYDQMLSCRRQKDLPECGVLLGILAAAAFFCSIYAGAFALAVWVLAQIPRFASDEVFRRDFCRTWKAQTVAAVLCAVFSAPFLLYLLRYQAENSPLDLGVMPCYGRISSWKQGVWALADLYFFSFPILLGIVYIAGGLAMLIPGVLPKCRAVSFGRSLTLCSFLLIGVVHSTFYSNDFGWRLITCGQFWMVFFALFIISRILGDEARISAKRKIFGRCLIALLSAALFISWYGRQSGISITKHDPAIHRAFARAVPGWEEVRRHAGKDDMVLCNPAGFFKIGKLHGYDSYSTNVFFSLYARRYTPVADLIYAQCYSEFFSRKKLQKLHGRVCRIFEGNPTPDDADYLAGELKVRAILVTPLDGLWNAPGALEKRYPFKTETPDYRVYWREGCGK